MSTDQSTSEIIASRRDGTESISPTATVAPGVILSGHPQIRDSAKVMNSARVTNAARVIESGRVNDQATVTDHGMVYGSASMYGWSINSGAEVGGNAYLGDAARIRDNAVVHTGNFDLTADVCCAHDWLAIGPIGSEHRTATFFRAYNPRRKAWTGIIAAGCFRGTTDKLTERLDNGEGWNSYSYAEASRNRFEADYRAFIGLCAAREATWEPISASEMAWWEERLSDPQRTYLRTRMDDYELEAD
jgi:carbonic anhydrase/acetyltransferase-like protein (isoleucine patch superfamily)